mmetsp:Transcript_36147/g.112543  ORF Transcript_36147/g.112543 Transcript_36147/m.112543 type:complete len:266 (-) Transcript_36147:41-838(-)
MRLQDSQPRVDDEPAGVCWLSLFVLWPVLHGQQQGSLLANPRHRLLEAAPPRLVVGVGAVRVADALQGQRLIPGPVDAVDGLEAAEEHVLLGLGARVLGQRHEVPEDGDVELHACGGVTPAPKHGHDHLLQEVPHLLQLNTVRVWVAFGQPAVAQGQDAGGALVAAALQHHRGRIARWHQGLGGELLQPLHPVVLALGEQPQGAHEPHVALAEDRRSLRVHVVAIGLQVFALAAAEAAQCTVTHQGAAFGRRGPGVRLCWLPSLS